MSHVKERCKTVKELIEVLSSLPEDHLVILEGCDCFGDWSGEVDVEEDGTVLLRRS